MSVVHYITTSDPRPTYNGLDPYNFAIGLDLDFDTTISDDEDVALARAFTVALNTDRRALPDDILPDERNPDRRGWWGDLDADTIRGGWPIGCRLWLMSRAKLTDASSAEGSALARATLYINEAIQPFVDNGICSGFRTALRQEGNDKIVGTITVFRGPKAAIALQYQSLWAPYGG